MRHNVIKFRSKRRGWQKQAVFWAAVIPAGIGLGWIARLAFDGDLTLPLPAQTSAEVICIADVHDGDTIRTCKGEKIRVENIDAPEMRGSPKCRRGGWCDPALAEQSRDELAAFLSRGPVSISRSGTDRYDRTLATLSVNGEDAGEYLIERGLARPWK